VKRLGAVIDCIDSAVAGTSAQIEFHRVYEVPAIDIEFLDVAHARWQLRDERRHQGGGLYSDFL
jgi:hypothetical protein